MQLDQRVRELSQEPALIPVWAALAGWADQIIEDALTIQQIPAPTFNEHARANHVLSLFGDYDLQGCGIDAVNNAFGRYPGTQPDLPAVLVSAHTDTVFGQNTDLSYRRTEDNLIYGPGLGDNSLAVAAMLSVPRLLRQFDLRPARDIWFVATSREEGLGNLDGIRAFYQAHHDQLGFGLNLEGTALGRIYHHAIPVRRLRITCKAEGGHSWYYFGQTSAIHDLVQLGARLVSLEPPAHPRTTFNIGVIEGGHSINSLANTAALYLDMRSEKPEALQALEADVQQIIEDARQAGAQIEVEVIGDRPGGSIRKDHPLVKATAASLEAVGLSAKYQSGSTDANLLLAEGLPAVTIGVAYGGNAHRLDEFIDPEPLPLGMKHLVLLLLAVSAWSPA